MFIENNPLEKREEKRRIILAIICSLLIYIIIVIVFFLTNQLNLKKDEVIIVDVRLSDKIIEEMNQISMAEKQGVVNKTQKKEKEKIVKELEQRKKDIEKKMVTENKQEDNKTVTRQKEIKETQSISETREQPPVEKDLFEEYQNKQQEEKDALIKKFNTSDTPKQIKDETGSDKLNDLKKELDNLNAVLNDINSGNGQDSVNNNNKKTGNSNDKIQWYGGERRQLIYRTNLVIPDEFKKEGLKTSLRLKFSVLDNGLISSVDILVSTGNNQLDQVVVNQFRKWKFQEAKGVNEAIGSIDIDIGY